MGIFFGKKKRGTQLTRGIRKSYEAPQPKRSDTVLPETSKKFDKATVRNDTPKAGFRNCNGALCDGDPTLNNGGDRMLQNSGNTQTEALKLFSGNPEIHYQDTLNETEGQDPLSLVVNLYGLSLSIFNIARALTTVKIWDDPIFIQIMNTLATDLSNHLTVIRHATHLRNWVHPLHYRKTGAVLGAARRLIRVSEYFYESLNLLKTGGSSRGPLQRQLEENLKELVHCYVKLVNGTMMVVPSDFSAEINELARTVRQIIDTSNGKTDFIFDDVARIGMTCSIRLSNLSLWKTIQVNNYPWSQQVSNTCFAVTKAIKVMYHVGLKLYQDPANQSTAEKNLTTLTKAVVIHLKKLQDLVQTDPPDQGQAVINYSQEVIKEHVSAYDQGIKEVSFSLEEYVRNNTEDLTVVGSINTLLAQLDVIKKVMQGDNNVQDLVVAVATISSSLEKFCGAVYFALHEIGMDSEVIKEQLMETMQHAMHCTIQLHQVACSKVLQFVPLNPSVTMLTCIRSLLISVSIILDSVDYLKSNKLLNEAGPENHVALGQAELNEAIIYILHYGRPLFKGDQGVDPEGTTSSGYRHSNYQLPPLDVEKSGSYPASPISPSPVATRSKSPSPAVTPSLQSPKNRSPRSPLQITVSPTHQSTKTPAEEEEDWLLSIDPESYNVHNLPPGFEPPPQQPIKDFPTEEEYKAYILFAKYEYETWENKLILYKMRLKRQIQEIKRKRGIM